MGAQLIRAEEASHPRPIWCVTPQNWREVAGGLPAPALSFAEASGFKAEPGALLVLPAADGSIAGVIFGCEEFPRDPLSFGKLATALPAGDYRIAHPPADPRLAALGFLLRATASPATASATARISASSCRRASTPPMCCAPPKRWR